jgi:hypothetical protein
MKHNAAGGLFTKPSMNGFLKIRYSGVDETSYLGLAQK